MLLLNQPTGVTYSTAEEKEYRQCENCGFRLMEVLPPTKGTYPLPVEVCPICGRRRDDHGFFPGEKLTPEAKHEAFRRWLISQGLNEDILRSNYHLSMEDFFGD